MKKLCIVLAYLFTSFSNSSERVIILKNDTEDTIIIDFDFVDEHEFVSNVFEPGFEDNIENHIPIKIKDIIESINMRICSRCIHREYSFFNIIFLNTLPSNFVKILIKKREDRSRYEWGCRYYTEIVDLEPEFEEFKNKLRSPLEMIFECDPIFQSAYTEDEKFALKGIRAETAHKVPESFDKIPSEVSKIIYDYIGLSEISRKNFIKYLKDIELENKRLKEFEKEQNEIRKSLRKDISGLMQRIKNCPKFNETEKAIKIKTQLLELWTQVMSPEMFTISNIKEKIGNFVKLLNDIPELIEEERVIAHSFVK